MTPEAAWANDIFRAYLAIVAGILVIAGLVLAALHFGLGVKVTGIRTTWRGWLVMAPLGLGSVAAGREVTVVFFTLLSVFGFKEFARATGLYRDWWMTGAGYLCITAVGVVTLAPAPDAAAGSYGWYGLFIVLPVYFISLLLAIPILRNKTEGQLQAVSLAIVGVVYIGWMFGHLAFLTNSANPYGYLLYVLFATEINDVAAFTFGKSFGRRKLRSNISPNKTWGGSLGALAVSMALPWALWFSFPHFGPLQLVLSGLIVGVGGQFGDLAISLIKRDVGIKDMGATIPGHGGLLDRLDSLIFVAPLFLHMVRFFHGL